MRVRPQDARKTSRRRQAKGEDLRLEANSPTAADAKSSVALAQLEKEPETTRSWVERVMRDQEHLRGIIEQQKEELDALSAMVELLIARGGDEVRERTTYFSEKLAYARMLRSIRALVGTTIPSGSNVLVISKGDDEMLKLVGAEGWHFPQNMNGAYAGYYPANCVAAIAHLEALRAKGADFLLIPKTAFWWLDQYGDFREHVQHFYESTLEDDEACRIYDLRQRCASALSENLVNDWHQRLNRWPVILDWNTGADLRSLFPECDVFSPVVANGSLPYVDHSIDVVAVSAAGDELGEARRVANVAVLRVSISAEKNSQRAVLSAEPVNQNGSARGPSASIVVYRHGSFPGLRILKESLAETLVDEVIILSDAPEDECGSDGSDTHNQFVECVNNADVVTAINRASRRSKSEILVFIDHEVIPLPGWLSALLRVFREHASAGVVGGKILNFDGSIWEAGGEILSDGHLGGFGRGDQKSHLPRYNYVRQVDFCSEGLLAVRRSLFRTLGGFNVALPPTHFAADFCLRLQERGFATFYQPEAVAVRATSEGKSNGRATLAEVTFVANGLAEYPTQQQRKTRARRSSHTIGAGKSKSHA